MNFWQSTAVTLSVHGVESAGHFILLSLHWCQPCELFLAPVPFSGFGRAKDVLTLESQIGFIWLSCDLIHNLYYIAWNCSQCSHIGCGLICEFTVHIGCNVIHIPAHNSSCFLLFPLVPLLLILLWGTNAGNNNKDQTIRWQDNHKGDQVRGKMCVCVFTCADLCACACVCEHHTSTA